jgi:tRNA(fMet)-specific endonuclease VapC
MFILDTDHISLFQRRDPHVTTRVLATPALKLATTMITVEEQLRGRLDRVRRARSDAEVVRAYHSLLATFFYFRTITVIDFDEQAQTFFTRLRA